MKNELKSQGNEVGTVYYFIMNSACIGLQQREHQQDNNLGLS